MTIEKLIEIHQSSNAFYSFIILKKHFSFCCVSFFFFFFLFHNIRSLSLLHSQTTGAVKRCQSTDAICFAAIVARPSVGESSNADADSRHVTDVAG